MFAKDDALKRPNLVVHQVTGKLPFQLEVTYESASSSASAAGGQREPLRGDAYDALLAQYRKAFADQFEERFHLVTKDE